jgi:hypothetical protein
MTSQFQKIDSDSTCHSKRIWLWTRLHDSNCCLELKPEINVFSKAWPRLHRDRYEPLITIAHAPSSLPIVIRPWHEIISKRTMLRMLSLVSLTMFLFAVSGLEDVASMQVSQPKLRMYVCIYIVYRPIYLVSLFELCVQCIVISTGGLLLWSCWTVRSNTTEGVGLQIFKIDLAPNLFIFTPFVCKKWMYTDS